MIDCSLRSFSRYIPSNIKKPKPADWGTSLCKVWAYSRKSDKLITYKEWQSEAVEKTKTSKKKDATQKNVTINTKSYKSVKV